MGDQSFSPEVVHRIINQRGVSFKGLIGAFSLSALLFVPMLLWMLGVRPPGMALGAVAPPPPSIAQIQSLSELATTRVHISDFIEGENDHYIGRWTLHGEAVLGVDLSGVRYVKTDKDARRATLLLPQPHVISSKVDPERSEEVSMKWKTWVPTSSPKLLRDEVWKHADRKIERLAKEIGFMERAKVQAERVLGQLFEGVGWKVDLEWQ